MSTIWLGLITCVFATLFTALGLVIQKHSINMGENLLPLYQRWRWFTGLALLVCCGGFFDSLALALAPLSMLSPLSGLSILANVVLASLFLGEQVKRVEVISFFVMIFGLCFTSAYGAHSSPNYDAQILIDLWLTDRMLIYFGATLLLVSAALITMHRTAEESIQCTVSWAAFAAILGAQQNIFLKCAVELVRDSVRQGGSDQTHTITLWVMLLAAIAFAVSQLWAINQGLTRYSAVLFLPIYQALLVVSGVSAGGIYFNEFAKLRRADWAGFLFGLGLTLSGLLTLLVLRPKDDKAVVYSAVICDSTTYPDDDADVWDEGQPNIDARDQAVFL